jgi:uncharacterized membrane protein YphA (DoxX/SURF4 family)
LIRLLSSPVTGAICRVLLGVAFVYTDFPKLMKPYEFARLIYGYRILHPDMVNLVGVILPWVELVPGAFLVIGILPRSAAALLGGLLAFFIGAAGLVMARGLNISCGCFFPFLSDRVGWVMIARDAVLLLLAVQIVIWPSSFLPKRGKRGS